LADFIGATIVLVFFWNSY